MSALTEIQSGFDKVLDSLSEGWRHLKQVAAGALTRFTPGHRDDDSELAVTSPASVGWAVLAGDVREDDDTVHIKLEVPGMDSGDFDISVRGQALCVRGEKRVRRADTHGDMVVVQCAYGSFERRIPLPARVSTDKAQASYDAGVLRVSLPKADRPRRVKVRVKTLTAIEAGGGESHVSEP